MPRAQVLAARPNLSPLPDYPPSWNDGPRTTYEEKLWNGTLGLVTYHFRDDGGDDPLYLMEVYYQDDAMRDRVFAERYAPHGTPRTAGAALEVFIEDLGPPTMVWVLGRLYLQLK